MICINTYRRVLRTAALQGSFFVATDGCKNLQQRFWGPIRVVCVPLMWPHCSDYYALMSAYDCMALAGLALPYNSLLAYTHSSSKERIYKLEKTTSFWLSYSNAWQYGWYHVCLVVFLPQEQLTKHYISNIILYAVVVSLIERWHRYRHPSLVKLPSYQLLALHACRPVTIWYGIVVSNKTNRNFSFESPTRKMLLLFLITKQRQQRTTYLFTVCVQGTFLAILMLTVWLQQGSQKRKG